MSKQSISDSLFTRTVSLSRRTFFIEASAAASLCSCRRGRVECHIHIRRLDVGEALYAELLRIGEECGHSRGCSSCDSRIRRNVLWSCSRANMFFLPTGRSDGASIARAWSPYWITLSVVVQATACLACVPCLHIVSSLGSGYGRASVMRSSEADDAFDTTC